MIVTNGKFLNSKLRSYYIRSLIIFPIYYAKYIYYIIIFLLLQRMDLGDCPKVHDLALRADYEKASKSKDYYYDIDVSS